MPALISVSVHFQRGSAISNSQPGKINRLQKKNEFGAHGGPLKNSLEAERLENGLQQDLGRSDNIHKNGPLYKFVALVHHVY